MTYTRKPIKMNEICCKRCLGRGGEEDGKVNTFI